MAYELRRSTGASCTASSAIITGPTSSRSHTDTELTHGTTYRYCVTAVGSNGRPSPVSNTRSVKVTDLTAPAAPSLSATGGNEEVSLSWPAVSDPTTPITYRLYRSTSPSCSTSSTLIRTQTALSYIDTGLEEGTIYRYCVTATDGAGNASGASASQTATPAGTSLLTTYNTTTGWDTHLAADITGNNRADLLSYHPSNGSWCITSRR